MFVIVGSFFLLSLPKDIAAKLIDEDGPVEMLQAILFIVGAIISIFYRLSKVWGEGHIASFLLTILALRELDFQVKFTEISITRTKFYFSPDISITSKIIAGILMLIIVSILIRFAWRNLSLLFKGVINKKISSILAMNGLIYIVFSNLIDRSLTILTIIGFEDTIRMEFEKTFFEELTELAIPASFLLALIVYGVSHYKGKMNPKFLNRRL